MAWLFMGYSGQIGLDMEDRVESEIQC